MAPKYTILKVLTRTSNKGFTLLELLVGMIITLIVGGLAMEAFINASKTFSQDKKSIDSNQNLSAVLEIIGNDIWQSGEQISDTNFPTIEFATNTDAGAMAGSSKITVRRSLSDPLTLCQNIVAGATGTKIFVADTTQKNISANCDVGTSTSQLIGSRMTKNNPAKYYTLPLATAPSPALALYPTALRKLRDYRCQSYDPNPATAYDDDTKANTEFCVAPAASQRVRMAVSDTKGHISIFNETGEEADAGNAADSLDPATYTGTDFKKYSIDVNTVFLGTATDNNNSYNLVNYSIGNPIYLIEERVYALSSNGDLQVSVDGQPAQSLIKRIAKFSISARVYNDVTSKTLNTAPADGCVAGTNTQFATDSTYTCKFNARNAAATPTDPAYNWKTLAGVKIQLQAQYDGTGQNPTPTQTDLDKLTATAEFFPRNVMSK
jgi:prepilin-type N-terminal cleavage/methylation domain-containing protein